MGQITELLDSLDQTRSLRRLPMVSICLPCIACNLQLTLWCHADLLSSLLHLIKMHITLPWDHSCNVLHLALDFLDLNLSTLDLLIEILRILRGFLQLVFNHLEQVGVLIDLTLETMDCFFCLFAQIINLAPHQWINHLSIALVLVVVIETIWLVVRVLCFRLGFEFDTVNYAVALLLLLEHDYFALEMFDLFAKVLVLLVGWELSECSLGESAEDLRFVGVELLVGGKWLRYLQESLDLVMHWW